MKESLVTDQPDLSAEYCMRAFKSLVEREYDELQHRPWLARWFFADALESRGQRLEMSFYQYEGPQHLRKFFGWISKVNYADYINGHLVDRLCEQSVTRDIECARILNVSIPESVIRFVARYNAQDYVFQRAYPIPERQKIRVLLDFGAGHGRMANLAFAPDATTELLIAVDAIPSSYLTQRAYYHGLGLKTADYLDYFAASRSFSFDETKAVGQVIHLPTWRLELVPNQSVDMVCCVQVLKELPRRLQLYVIGQFARILRPGGALYVRDHVQFHDPTHMPIDEILSTSGFVLEFRPHIHDRVDIHGIPRIWRRFDGTNYLKDDD
jgi:SAM-dependent methyltransferase